MNACVSCWLPTRRWLLLYWDIGKAILARQEREGWGAGTIDRLSHDLRAGVPGHARDSPPRNLKYMRAFAASLARARNRARGACTNHLVPQYRTAGEG